MWFEQIIREETGCATYMVGSSETGQCLVFDPLWDTAPFSALAEKKGARITHVIDSHCHADHISGARRLARATGAALLLPAAAGVEYEVDELHPGDRIRLGEVEAEVLAMPGHRPEQVNLLFYDRSRSDEPWFLLTADFLMVGDLARPDLGQEGALGSSVLFRESIPRLLSLPDHVEVYPGHVAGST